MSTNYSVTRDDIILSAFRKLGLAEPQDTLATLDSSFTTNAAIQFNLMIKQWATEGLKIWTVETDTIPLLTFGGFRVIQIGYGGADFPLKDKPMRIIQAWRNQNTSPVLSTPLAIISRQEMNLMAVQQQPGTPNSIYLEPKQTYSNMYLWPIPDPTDANVLAMSISYVYQREISDLSLSTSVPEFPNEWMNVLVWGLADELSVEFGVPEARRKEITARAMAYLEKLKDWDIENEPTMFVPDSRYSSFGYSKYA